MAPEKECVQAGILKKLIGISHLQRRLAAGNRIEELLASRAEREELFARLDLSCEACRPELKELAEELAESDRLLSDAIKAMMDSIGARLGQVKTGMNALKAYGRY